MTSRSIEKVTGYKKIKFFTHENAGYGDVHSAGDADAHRRASGSPCRKPWSMASGCPRPIVIDGLRGLGRGARDGGRAGPDVRSARPRPAPSATAAAKRAAPGRDPFGGRTGGFDPTVFLFDAQPGRRRASRHASSSAPSRCSLGARSLIETCPCRAGCPGCVGPHEGAGSKEIALAILAAIGVGA